MQDHLKNPHERLEDAIAEKGVEACDFTQDEINAVVSPLARSTQGSGALILQWWPRVVRGDRHIGSRLDWRITMMEAGQRVSCGLVGTACVFWLPPVQVRV